MATKSYVSLDALTRYDEKIKAYLAALDAEVLLNANKNAEDLVKEVKTYVGEIPAGYTEETIIAYINKKAEETLSAATGGSSESAASVKAALDTYKAENDPKVAANTDAIAAINDETDGILAQAKAYADTEDAKIEQSVSDLSGKVTTLIGEDAGKSVRTISAEEVAKIVAGADESYDTLKEIADWISTHGSDAAAMNSAIVALQAIVDGIGGEGEQATVVAYVDAAIAALSIGDYAKAADLTALAARVTTLEGASHTHANKDALDTYDKTQTELLAAAKTEAQGLVTAHETAVNAALEGKADKATTLAGYGIIDAYTKTEVDGLIAEFVEVTDAEIDALFAESAE